MCEGQLRGMLPIGTVVVPPSTAWWRARACAAGHL